MKNLLSALVLVVSATALWLLSPAVKATPIYGCTAGSACNGNQYAVWVKSHVGNTWQLQYDIKVLSSYTGNHWTDVVDAIAIKDFASSYSSISLVSAPGGVGNWNLFTQPELSANGCSSGSSAQPCIEAKEPGYAGVAVQDPAGFANGEVLSWVLQFDATSLNATAAIKYLYEDTADNKVGSLGSWDINIQTERHQRVPEPATLALMGLGLLGLGLIRKLRRAPARS